MGDKASAKIKLGGSVGGGGGDNASADDINFGGGGGGGDDGSSDGGGGGDPYDQIGKNSDSNWMNDGAFDDEGSFSSDRGAAGRAFWAPAKGTGGGGGGLTPAQWLFVTTIYNNGPILNNYALDNSGVYREITNISAFSLALAYQNQFDNWGQNGVATSISAAIIAYDGNPNRTGPGLTLNGRLLFDTPNNLTELSQSDFTGILLNQVDIKGGKGDENYLEGIETFISPLDKGLTLAESPGLVNEAYSLASKSSTALGYLGKFTGVATIFTSGGTMIYDYRHGDFISGTWNLAKAAGQVVILTGGGEEVELFWNTGVLAVDGISGLFKK